MICRVIGKKPSGILVYTNRVNQAMIGHLKSNAQFIGKGVWLYSEGRDRLLFAVGNYIGLGKKAFIKKQLEDLE